MTQRHTRKGANRSTVVIETNERQMKQPATECVQLYDSVIYHGLSCSHEKEGCCILNNTEGGLHLKVK